MPFASVTVLAAFAKICGGIPQDELAGKSPRDLFPQEDADKLQAGIERKIKEPSFDGVELALPGTDGKEHLYRVSLYVFLDRQEQDAAKEAPLPESVVAIFKDITRFRRQAQKAQERQHHLMEALVRAVEYVDPNLVGHTRKMRHVAELLARHMELDNTAVLTLRMASQLSQIGKIFVPHHLLRKSGKLTPEEQQAVLQSSEYAFRVLYGINFGLPVPEALHDMNEKCDGSGPRALKGDQINPHARLLAVVNAFCSMVSDRAYRQGMPSARPWTSCRPAPPSIPPSCWHYGRYPRRTCAPPWPGKTALPGPRLKITQGDDVKTPSPCHTLCRKRAYPFSRKNVFDIPARADVF